MPTIGSLSPEARNFFKWEVQTGHVLGFVKLKKGVNGSNVFGCRTKKMSKRWFCRPLVDKVIKEKKRKEKKRTSPHKINVFFVV